jgi:hypothetical protein
MRFHVMAPSGHPDFLDLPWEEPLEAWDSGRLVEVSRGLSRHVVRFAAYPQGIYALKELPARLARREYRLLGQLAERSLPVVEVVGVVEGRTTVDGADLEAVLITHHLEFSLPYRRLFVGRSVPHVGDRLLDALSHLLVRLHLVGFFWGDCSLSNALFRRDAGALAAYLVDAETGELHPNLSDGQRAHDLAVAEENIVGELFDVEAMAGLPAGLDPVETAAGIRRRYEDLWSELTREEEFHRDERHRMDRRLQRLNELGYDVEELELESVGASVPERYRLRFHPLVVEQGHHRRRLFGLTGLDVQENQARRLLNDLATFRVGLEEEARALPESVVAFRWLTEAFEPTIAEVPADLRGKLAPAELYHEILEHRWYLCEAADRDVGLDEAVASYVEQILRHAPDERAVLRTGPIPRVPSD